MSLTNVTVRGTDSSKKLLFIHGFGGNAHHTFGMMPAFLAGHPALTEWDIHSLGYPTALQPDITGVWAADPPLTTLASALREELDGTFGGVHLSFITHSMGGLLLQRALLDGDFQNRVENVLFFGVPSAGLWKARLGRFFKRQVKDMHPDSDFIKDLNSRRPSLFTTPSFRLKVIAGLRDEFVPETSSLTPFDAKFHSRVDGNHTEMVKPESVHSASVRRVISLLAGNQATPDVLKSLDDAGAVEHPRQIVDRAQSLELAGYDQEAIQLLEEHRERNPFVTGALAGIYKRRWFASDGADPSDAERALTIYKEAFGRALAGGWFNAAGYAGINSAFMTLALDPDDGGLAATIADQAVKAKEKADNIDKWLPIVQGEASIHLGKPDTAIERYRSGLPALGTREKAQAIKQAIWTARALEDQALEERLRSLLSLSNTY